MEEKHARLLQAIDYLKDKGQIHKQQDIADKLGKGKSYISEVMANKNGRLTDGFPLSPQTILKISKLRKV